MATPDSSPAAAIITATASLISALAWPTLIGFVLYSMYTHSDRITSAVSKFMQDKSSAKLGLSVASGLTIEIVEKAVVASTNAVIKSVENSDTAALDARQVGQVESSAKSAAYSLTGQALDPQKRLKVLWVDDHPENNTDLQFAFQVLSIVVICVDSNDGIKRAFGDTGDFDVVITDMGRDEVKNRHVEDWRAGLKTVEIIKSNYRSTKVIIYAAKYAEDHRNDPKSEPVILVSNRPQEVYRAVVKLAAEKAL